MLPGGIDRLQPIVLSHIGRSDEILFSVSVVKKTVYLQKGPIMHNPFKSLNPKDWFLWIASLTVVTVSNIAGGSFDFLTLIATWVGITALIFAAKGNAWTQVFMILFAVLYAIISFRFRYWGEMITYLGMSLPMAVCSLVSWIRNQSGGKQGAVSIRQMTGKLFAVLAAAAVLVTVAFYFLLGAFDTPNLFFSTLSVATSFFAASLTVLRSSYFALAYALNDVVLMILWTLAALKDPVYIPVIVNFLIFLVNDTHTFVSWKRRERTQTTGDRTPAEST